MVRTRVPFLGAAGWRELIWLILVIHSRGFKYAPLFFTFLREKTRPLSQRSDPISPHLASKPGPCSRPLCLGLSSSPVPCARCV